MAAPTGARASPVAVITDIHGNLPALQAALDRIQELAIPRVFCGGDLVGYGPRPNEVCALIAERGIPTIYGNYDYAIARDLTTAGAPISTSTSANSASGRSPAPWSTSTALDGAQEHEPFVGAPLFRAGKAGVTQLSVGVSALLDDVRQLPALTG